MKGFIKQFATGCGFGAILFTLAGCYHYRNLVDSCWPERHNAQARQSIRDMSNAQANQGHELGQTIFNWHFEQTDKGAPSARLNAAGIEVLKSISRRKPYPDTQLYLQNAQDIFYTQGANADEVIRKRDQMNSDRKKAIADFLRTQTAVLGGSGYQIAVRDVATPGINARPITGTKANPTVNGAVPGLEQNFKGVLPAEGVGGGGIGGGGGSGSGGSGGSGGGMPGQ